MMLTMPLWLQINMLNRHHLMWDWKKVALDQNKAINMVKQICRKICSLLLKYQGVHIKENNQYQSKW